MAVELPEYLPLEEAARRYRLSPEILTRAVEDGKIRAVCADGRILVAEEDVQKMTKRDALWSQVAHLDGSPIALEQACSRYAISSPSLYRWIDAGYVRVLEDQRGGGRGRKRVLNEADVAYAALVAKERGRRRGKPIFTEEFLPPHLRP